MTTLAIVYYRVSTNNQGFSGLGLEAQRVSVERYAKNHGFEIVAEYTEVKSATGKRKRTEVYKAIEEAKQQNATLLIAKLDRLSRSVAFTSTLLESGIDFIAVDLPTANKLTVHILSAIAEHEATMVSQRTKEALAALKAQGVKLGSPQNLTDKARKAGAVVNHKQAIEEYRTIAGYARLLKEQGYSLAKISERLNNEGHRTRQGKLFHANTVWRILRRAEIAKT